MSRRGIVPTNLPQATPGVRVPISAVQSSIGLARRIVVSNVIGVRADIEVPKSFLGSFRYRWGFLILTDRCVPAGLVRWILAQWLTHPHDLWLASQVYLRRYLREVPLGVAMPAPGRVGDSVFNCVAHRAGQIIVCSTRQFVPVANRKELKRGSKRGILVSRKPKA